MNVIFSLQNLSHKIYMYYTHQAEKAHGEVQLEIDIGQGIATFGIL